MKTLTLQFVPHNGTPVLAGWPERIQTAQLEKTVRIFGRVRERVRFGEEVSDWKALERPCHDCVVLEGQFHVPGCEAEECPGCGGQVIACNCMIEKMGNRG